MKTTPREILSKMQVNKAEHDRILDMAEKAGIYEVTNDVAGGWRSMNSAIRKAVDEQNINLDEEIEL